MTAPTTNPYAAQRVPRLPSPPTTNHQPPTTNCQLKTEFQPARPLRLIRGAARSPEPWYPAEFHELPAFLRQRPAIQTAQPISTAVPGLQICEDLPKLAARAEQLCVISSMTHDVVNHTTAPHWLLPACKSPGDTGLPLDRDWPSIGSGLNQQGLAVVPRDASGQIAGWKVRATSNRVHSWFKITPAIPLRLSVKIRVHP